MAPRAPRLLQKGRRARLDVGQCGRNLCLRDAVCAVLRSMMGCSAARVLTARQALALEQAVYSRCSWIYWWHPGSFAAANDCARFCIRG